MRSMWTYQQDSPGTFTRKEIPAPTSDNLEAGELLLRFAAGAICGSDIPKFLGTVDPDNPTTGQPGVPLHELVAYVEHSQNPEFLPGQRVISHVPGARGLNEYLVGHGRFAHVLSPALDDVSATMIQPLCTVLNSLDRVGSVAGKNVAVLGLGPLGLLFCHAAATAGAASVIGVDRVDRSDVRAAFGIDYLVHSEPRRWAKELHADHPVPDVVIDAIGHRQEVLTDAIEVVKNGGQLLVFGLPEDFYVFPMRRSFRKGLALAAGAMASGVNEHWHDYLTKSENYVLAAPTLPKDYITHVFNLDDVQTAYRTAAQPGVGRLKVAIRP
ncbi:MAG: zinc-binding dehydrogenase [Propionibacteriaceae bacterium]|nr:zinc-binding dehydrogenase [Propionibacteriaceae bacterium]